ncbi:MAG: putative colanic acid biosynthesis acetyltransferase, partial [Fimbriimonadaceae bacterium]
KRRSVFLALPDALSAARIAILRLMGAKIGRTCLVKGRVRILMPWNLEMEDRATLGFGTEVLNFCTVRIEAFATVSQYCYLCTGSHDFSKRSMPLVYGPIVVGRDAWVAAWVFVGPGVTIGEGAVVGARSVVAKDVPPWTVCAGNPCRPIRERTLDD